jgi:molybdopterin-containing oxidoreductase family iron-sulfur binding subunit
VRARSISGAAAEPSYDLSRADVIVSLDADFLLEGPANLTLTKAFSQRRRDPANDFNRLYVVESAPSITGAKADRRWQRKPSEVVAFAESLAAAVLQAGTNTAPEIEQIVVDLQNHRGRSVVIAGDYQPERVHALAFQINQALGNIGTTVLYTEAAVPQVAPVGIADFIAALRLRADATLLIAGPNPVYDFPPQLGFAEVISHVSNSIHLGLYDDETGSRCQWHVPESHYLEAWGDILSADGTPSIIQPLIEPLYSSTASLLEVMSLLVDLPPQKGFDLVHNFWSSRLAAAGPAAWERSLNKGVIVGAISGGAPAPVLVADVVVPAPGPQASGIEILFRTDPAVDDGRYANNGWLQELPRPVTKLTWDNVAMISPNTAQKIGLETSQIVKLTVGKETVSAPIWIQPGHADECVSVALGSGRTKVGEVGNGVGFNANLLRSADLSWSHDQVQIEKTDAYQPLASTQHHFSMEGRGLIQVETLADYKIDPRKAEENEPDPDPSENLYPPFQYKNYAWAMSIDLNTCIGCNACIVACQAENNIPVVGKDQVLKGREMHWLRVDRYFEGAPEDPAIHFQPVPCMHCEDAPCEVVCPVGATVHSSEGLNDMVYNRCVGTRYCSNNCPYKVRRFNFFQYSDTTHPTIALQKNPDVTVRSRGVMEKCTYCVQRIEAARIDSQKEMRSIRDGEIVTACQAACPADAIVFGNINDPASRVSKLKALPRNYGLLADLNTRPRTTYLAKVTNPPEA